MNHHSRAMSGAVRQAIITSYANGNSIGFETAQRSLWEIGDTMADWLDVCVEATSMSQIDV